MEILFKPMGYLGYLFWLLGIMGVITLFRYLGESISKVGIWLNDSWLSFVFSVLGFLIMIPSSFRLLDIFTNGSISFVHNFVMNFYQKYPMYEIVEMVIGLILLWLFFIENASIARSDETYMSFNGLLAVSMMLIFDFVKVFMGIITQMNLFWVLVYVLLILACFISFQKLNNYSDEFSYYSDEGKVDSILLYSLFLALLEPEVLIVLSIIYMFQKIIGMVSNEFSQKIFREDFYDEFFLWAIKVSSSFVVYLLILRVVAFPVVSNNALFMKFGINVFIVSVVFILLYTFRIPAIIFLVITTITNIYFFIYLPSVDGTYIQIIKEIALRVFKVRVRNFNFVHMNLAWLFLFFVVNQVIFIFGSVLKKIPSYKEVITFLQVFSLIPLMHFMFSILFLPAMVKSGYLNFGILVVRVKTGIIIFDVFTVLVLLFVLFYMKEKARDY